MNQPDNIKNILASESIKIADLFRPYPDELYVTVENADFV